MQPVQVGSRHRFLSSCPSSRGQRLPTSAHGAGLQTVNLRRRRRNFFLAQPPASTQNQQELAQAAHNITSQSSSGAEVQDSLISLKHYTYTGPGEMTSTQNEATELQQPVSQMQECRGMTTSSRSFHTCSQGMQPSTLAPTHFMRPSGVPTFAFSVEALETKGSAQASTTGNVIYGHDSSSSSYDEAVAADSGPAMTLWVCLRQARQGGDADVYFSPAPLDDRIWQYLRVKPAKLATTHGRRFGTSLAASSHATASPSQTGSWHNFLIRTHGGFCVYDEEVMFPNCLELLRYEAGCIDSGAYTGSNQQGREASCGTGEGGSRRSSSNSTSTSTSRSPSGAADLPGATLQQEYAAAGSSSSSSSSSSSGGGGAGQAQPQPQPQRLRIRHNARGLDDLISWLADPDEATLLGHLANLGRCFNVEGTALVQRCYKQLQRTWGQATLERLGFTRYHVLTLLDDPRLLESYMGGSSSSSSSSSSAHPGFCV